jgi:hypothetical protein
MNNINILVEAKKEYTNQLQKILTPRLYEGFKSIYEDIINILSKELEENKTQGSSLIKTFQKMLKEIPQWNQEVIKTEYLRIEKLSNCDYFDNLIEAVFITNTKILTSVQINDSKSLNIKISVPQPSHFVHKCYIECSKEIYKNPYIFDQSKNLTPKERHNNLREVLHIIDNSINNAIRDLLPIRDILKQGLTKNNENINDLNKIINIENQQNGDNEEIEKIRVIEETETNEDTEEIELNINEEKDSNNNDEDNKKKDKDNKEEDDENNEGEDEDNEDNEDEDNEDEDNEDNEDEDNEDNEDEDNEGEYIEYENNKEDNRKEINDEKKEPIKKILVNESKNIIDLSKHEEEIILIDSVNNINETKEIIYNKVIPSFVKKIKNIEKIDDSKNIEIEKNIEFIYKKEDIEKKDTEKKVISSNDLNNPFVKKIKNKIFLKNKYGGIDKNNSFYKKKYEENSANYNSISDSLKNTIQNTILSNENKSIIDKKDKIIKNKIMLDINSSDDENSNDEVDL